MVAKYGEEQHGWFTSRLSGSAGCGVWKDIYKGMESFSRLISFRVHNGEMMGFWQDPWCTCDPLCFLFPECYDLAIDKWGLVKDHLI